MLKNTKVVEEYIKNHFSFVYSIALICPIYLMGGALKDIENDRIPKDLDFVCLCNNANEVNQLILDYINKFHLEYKINRLGDFKITVNDTTIDIWTTNDLLKAIQYNLDGLFFDVRSSSYIPFGYYDALENGLREINPNNNLKDKKENRKIKLYKYMEVLKSKK